MYMLYFVVLITLMYIVVKLFKWPLKMLAKLIVNCICGIILLIITNLIGKQFNFSIGINAFTVIISGFCGIPGVIFLILFKIIF
ncbi:MAG: pro-sigmaK processing inhibitor BofA family protein [Bacillota bacterium]|nr:pro-sigmaK processing inhibitor BofA family protein [Bacillota bacterium]